MGRDPLPGPVFHQLVRGDEALLAALRCGDPTAHRQVSQLLRHARLGTLKPHVRGLVEVLAACPDLHSGLRHAWEVEDPAFTKQLFAWVARRRWVAAA